MNVGTRVYSELPVVLCIDDAHRETHCHFCCAPASELKRCSSCHIVYYCSTKYLLAASCAGLLIVEAASETTGSRTNANAKAFKRFVELEFSCRLIVLTAALRWRQGCLQTFVEWRCVLFASITPGLHHCMLASKVWFLIGLNSTHLICERSAERRNAVVAHNRD